MSAAGVWTRTNAAASATAVLWIAEMPLGKTLDRATWLSTTEALRTDGWTVHLVTPDAAGTRSVDGVEITAVPAPRRYLIGRLAWYARLVPLLRVAADAREVVLAHPGTLPPILVARAFMPRLRRSPLLVDVRTVIMEDRRRMRLKVRLRALYADFALSLSLRHATGVTTITRRMRDELGVPESRMAGIWPSGYDPRKFQPRMPCSPSTDDSIRIVYIGSLHRERRVHTFAQAVVDACRAGARLTFVVAGEGSGRAELERLAAQSEAIELHPALAHDRVPGLLAGCHVGVLPFPDQAKFRVSSPIKLFEYLGSGLPILATRVICHTDVADNTFAVWAHAATVPAFVEALKELDARRSEIGFMSRAAARAAKSWTWQQAARRLGAALLLVQNRNCGRIGVRELVQSPAGTEL